MGWTTFRKIPGMSVKDTLQNEFPSFEMLATATVNLTEFYAAVKGKNGEVWAFVCAIAFYRGDGHNFGYKDMEESMGPVQQKCPARILDLLTPTDNKYALEWRAACRENIAAQKTGPKFVHGDRVHSPYPIEFTGLKGSLQDFTVSDPKRMTVWATETHYPLRLNHRIWKTLILVEGA